MSMTNLGPISNYKPLLNWDGKPPPELQATDLPAFPVEVMNESALAHYVNAFDSRNEICYPYHFASAISQISSVMGRAVWITGQPKPLYPNVYCVLLGDTAVARKSTAKELAVDHLQMVEMHDEYPDVESISSIATSEGLVHQLRTHEKRQAQRTVENEDGDKDTENYEKELSLYPNLPEFEGVRLFIHIDEMRSVFTKRRQQSSEGIISTITEAYSMPRRLQNTSKNASQRAEFPCVTLLGCTTKAWFEKGIRTEDIEGGFANRFMYFSHERMPYVPEAEPLLDEDLRAWSEFLVSLRMQWAGKHQKFTLSGEVSARKNDAYCKDMDRLYKSDDALLRAASARHQEHVHKLALIFTLTDTDIGNTEVGIEQWMKAEKVGEYLLKSNMSLFSGIVVDSTAQNEQRILEVLKRKGNTTSKRELRRSFNPSTMSADAFTKALDALEKAGSIEMQKHERKLMVHYTP